MSDILHLISGFCVRWHREFMQIKVVEEENRYKVSFFLNLQCLWTLSIVFNKQDLFAQDKNEQRKSWNFLEKDAVRVYGTTIQFVTFSVASLRKLILKKTFLNFLIFFFLLAQRNYIVLDGLILARFFCKHKFHIIKKVWTIIWQ